MKAVILAGGLRTAWQKRTAAPEADDQIGGYPVLFTS
jgi:hypothetical protein